MTTTKQVKWTSLIIGYETVSLTHGAPPPNLQSLIKTTFGAARLMQWQKGGTTQVPSTLDTDPTKGEWVGVVLQKEITAAIPAPGPALTVGRWVKLNQIKAEWRHYPTGRDGVRCEQGPKGWRNSVTHVLLIGQETWPQHPDVIGYATLTWDCPGDEAEAQAYLQ